MNKSERLFNLLKKKRLIALLTPKDAEQCLKAYEIFHSLGITLEIAIRSETAMDGIRIVLEKYPDALILAGTVMTRTQVEKAIELGVAGVVSADYIPAVLEICVKNNIMYVPGGLSDAGKQLAQKAELYGCEINELKEKYPYQWVYKLFPAVTATRSNIETASAWKGPYKGLTLIYTGGISLNNLNDVVEQDPNGIFCGSALTKAVDDPIKMKEEAEKWLSVIHKPKENKKVVKKTEKVQSSKVVTFGEIMLRLAPPNYLRFVQTVSYDATFGGAEANTAVAFANYGLESCFVTLLPEHEIGQAAINSLRGFGVDTTYVLRKGKRVGIYFLEYGASQRPSKVIYDRAGSSISEIKPGQINWKKVFENASMFHWSGITPALSDSAAEATLEAIKEAKRAGVTVSVDLNYRKKLWTKEKAQKIMSGLMEYVDIAIGNEEDAEIVFGLKAGTSNVTAGKLDMEGYKSVTEQMIKKFGFKKVAITLRESLSASDNIWSACL
ncbi:MAG: hypothetical protein J7L66_03805, partial [Anaerolineaceae bacterium]|nr:hypothetical protein [Anaerolineaceae bacterium]